MKQSAKEAGTCLALVKKILCGNWILEYLHFHTLGSDVLKILQLTLRPKPSTPFLLSNFFKTPSA
jgi:hypothetical protein